MSDTDLLPPLRLDIKVSRQVRKENVAYVVKDPLKGEYFRFEEHEWKIISLFDGKRTYADAVQAYNAHHVDDPIEISTLKEFQGTLEQMHLIVKDKNEMNIMLVEKMREMRQSQLLSKKGSVMYKRFPLVDPNKGFDWIIPKITFFWSRGFFIFSMITMLIAVGLVFLRWAEFQNGLVEVFTFSQLSFWNFAFLWITIYTIIAIHELGHGLTCKYYGGEVHEIGFLLLFFQPCLYANVNDAWLFDKKWKQVMVTVAGGYIEVFVGALFAILWAFTYPNTMINVLSLQVMAICSLATVAFNFNPLMKLDGYYLLADYLEIPNLRDNAFGYMKYLASRYIFKMEQENHESTFREKCIYVIYGSVCFLWVAGSVIGLCIMAKTMLTESLGVVGLLLSLWVAKIFLGGYVKKVGAFAVQLLMKHRGVILSKKGKVISAGALSFILALLFIPVTYSVKGICGLESQVAHVLRTRSDGIIRKFYRRDGEPVKSDDLIAEIENDSLETDRRIRELGVQKTSFQLTQAIHDNPALERNVRRELASKQAGLTLAKEKVEMLLMRAVHLESSLSILSCPGQLRKENVFIKAGEEVCRIEEIGQLRTVVQVTEQQVGYIQVGNPVQFKLQSNPLMTYRGRVHRIRDLGLPDPMNPKAKLYGTEILIENPGDLRPGMTGVAKVITSSIPIVQYFGRGLAGFFRFDLLF